MLAAAIALLLQDAGVQKVVAAVSAAARENAEKPEKERLAGDALADYYVRRACGAGTDGKSILLGLAHALDPSGTLAGNPVTGEPFKKIESPEEKAARVKALGSPTMRGRGDWLLHFFLTAGVAAHAGEDLAVAVGVQKEIADAKAKENGKGSGFSFTDLSADYAGLAFAQLLTGERAKEAIAKCAKEFSGTDYLPDADGLQDGLTWSEFEKAWGGVKDAKFRDECARLRVRVQGCKGHQ